MNSGAPAAQSSRAAADGHPRRAELAAFLRSRRARVTPEQAGLPPGRRRRTPGLRREEVAQLAGVGVTWYTWLEQGRSINASVQVLTAIARTLLLDQAEQDHLFRLADQPGTVGTDGSGATCEQVSAELQGILDALVPLPASIQNERFDVLAWNRAYAVAWPSAADARPGDRNSLWLNFTHAECCHPWVNRDEQLATLVAQFRSAYGRHVGEPAWTGFVRRLQAASPHFARLWEAHDVASPGPYLKVYRHPAFDRLAMTTTSFAVQSVPGTRLIVYTPADEVTRDAIRRLLAGEGAGARFPCWEEHRRRLADLPAGHMRSGEAAPDPDLAPSA
jgi:transcriptional regulator with XRE-family HTH domain